MANPIKESLQEDTASRQQHTLKLYGWVLLINSVVLAAIVAFILLQY